MSHLGQLREYAKKNRDIQSKATDILINTINCVARNHPSWQLEQKRRLSF